jgi:hypothetical protein
MTDKKLHDDLLAWVESDAPGQDRVRELRPPDLPKPPQPERTRQQRWTPHRWTENPFSVPRFALQGAVACALFAFGYFLGGAGTQPRWAQNERWAENPFSAQNERRWTENPFSVQAPGDSHPQQEGIPEPPGTRKDSRSSASPEQKKKPKPSPIVTHEENGRLVIETTLKNSGARALWVVDGRFDLAKSEG